MATEKATKRVAVIEGDDAAPEAVRPTIEVIKSMGLPIEWTYPIVGEPAKQEFGHPFPPVSREAIDNADTTFFGSTSGSSGGSLMYLRWGKQTYANVRPARYFRGAKSPLADPEGVDLVIVRENLEDLYVRAEGELASLSNVDIRGATIRKPLAELGEGRYAVKVITREGTERVVRFAFELARRRRKHLTCTSKYNMLPQTDGYFRDIALELASEYPDVEFDTFIVDDFACRIITEPRRFDVIVMPNLYGDILSDAAAGLVGGLGLAASGCYGDDYAYFESAHGTAPDIAGLHIINPTANLLSAAMMLEYLGFRDQAKDLDRAVRHVFATGELTPDQGGSASTEAFCEAVFESIERE
ncbi:MAG: isocitrate/isopropylmalate family dehydrogenase [Gammaproteobacteria bacterium]|nr:isocitrate/isopropylmalate family dehydrogenase [Gammaproteobacteria bacterium]